MPFNTEYIAAVVASFALSLGLTPAVRALARHRGVVAKPKADRWHKKPTAMLGGAAIFLTVLTGYLAFVPHTAQGWVVIVASSFLFFVGLVDDFLHIKPYQKLAGQVMGAAIVIYSGLSLPWIESMPLNMAITIFWLVGVSNAVNLLDNMDGLAAGVAAIAACFIAISLYANGQPTEALMLGVFVAALLGFLAYNSNPASIFMGDCGSLFVGFFLASTALLSASGGRARSFLVVIAVPVLILFIPIFDTTFVTVLRKLSGRAASQGGRDHTSHRLVALGLSERRAVLMLYAFAAASGVLALLVRELRFDLSVAVILGFTLLLTLVGVYLAGVKVYDEEEVQAARGRVLVSFLVDLSYKRRVFEVGLDVALIALAYYSAHVMLFGTFSDNDTWRFFLRTVPILVFVKLAALLAMGAYRGLWRYVSVDSLVVFAKAVAAGSVASVLALLFAFRFEGFSRAVFVLDAVFLFVMLAGSRVAFRLFRQLIPASSPAGRRVLIYGAGDAGELILREMRNNAGLRYLPVGFIDDDPLKKGKLLHGLRVYGGNGQLSHVCREQQVEEILISSTKLSEERITQIRRDCDEARITLRRMRIEIELLSDEY